MAVPLGLYARTAGIACDHGGRHAGDLRPAINTIGPLWDRNEVWLITAAAGMFAAFPGWYATMFSAMYLALALLLVAICVLHGATFLALKTTRDMRARAERLARQAAPITGLLVVGFALWTHISAGKGFFPNLRRRISPGDFAAKPPAPPSRPSPDGRVSTPPPGIPAPGS